MKQDLPDFEAFLAAARRGRAEVQPEMPLGLATRLAARGCTRHDDRLAPWEKLARWGALTASVAAIVISVSGRHDALLNPLIELGEDADETELFW